MELYVNGEAVDVQLEDEKTIGDVLHSFEVYCEDNQAAVVGIAIDEKAVNADDFDEAAKRELEANTKIAFDVVTLQQIGNSFRKIASNLSALTPRLENMSVSLQSGHGKDANEAIAELADCMGEFSRTAMFATLFPDSYKAVVVDGKPLSDFFNEMNPILSDFADAMKGEDTVTVGDLAEYEICPRLKAISRTLEAINA